MYQDYSINAFRLTELANDGKLKSFCTYLFYKSKVKKGRIFGNKDMVVANKLGLTRSCARKYRLLWIENGWCREHNGNLIFNSQRGYSPGEKFCKLKITIKSTIKETINEIYFQLLKLKHQQFEFLKSVSREITNPLSLRSYKRAKNKAKKLGKLPRQNDNFKISFKGLGGLFGCSDGKAHSIIKTLDSGGKIRVNKGIKQICGFSNERLLRIKAEGINNCFVSRKYIYKVYCNEYFI